MSAPKILPGQWTGTCSQGPGDEKKKRKYGTNVGKNYNNVFLSNTFASSKSLSHDLTHFLGNLRL